MHTKEKRGVCDNIRPPPLLKLRYPNRRLVHRPSPQLCPRQEFSPSTKTPEPVPTPTPEVAATQPTLVPSPNSATMPVTDLSPSSETPEPEYLTEAIPPCTPVEGVTIEPCAGVSPWVGSTLAHRDFDAQPRDLAWFLGGDRIVWARHFVIRGAYLPDTARCFVDNEYHTPTYLNLGTSDYGSSRIGRIKCYADVRVNEYLIGSGPSKLTLRVARPFYGIPMTETEIKEEFAALEAALTGGAPHWRLEVPEDGIIGIESILFIGPSSDVTEEVAARHQCMGLEDERRRHRSCRPPIQGVLGRPDCSRRCRNRSGHLGNGLTYLSDAADRCPPGTAVSRWRHCSTPGIPPVDDRRQQITPIYG